MSFAQALKVRGSAHFDLTSKLARKLESKREVPIPTPQTQYRVSGLSKMCPREEVLRHIHGVKKYQSIEARLQRVFDFGTAIHEFVQNNWFSDWLIGEWQCISCGFIHPGRKPAACNESCRSEGFRYKEITMILENEGISGHTDGVLDIDGKHVLLEIKTCSSKQYELITIMRKRPLDQHLDQVQLYMWLLGVDEAVIIYLEKDESLLAEFSVKKDDSVAEKFLKRVQDARSGMVSGKPPEREICDSPTCSRAKACSTKALCFA